MNEIVQHYVDQHTAYEASVDQPDWLKSQKAEGIENFGRSGFPTTRDEDWKYTSVKPIASKFLEVQTSATDSAIDLDGLLIAGLDSYRLVFVNGQIDAGMSILPESTSGVRLESLNDLITSGDNEIAPLLDQPVASSHAFSALNLAFSHDGFILRADSNAKLDKPIEIIFVSQKDNSVIQPRNVISLDRHAEVQLVIRHISAGDGVALDNSTCKITLDDGARLDCYLVESLNKTASQICAIEADLAKDSTFSCRTLTLGGGLVRNNLRVNLNAPGAHCDMLGLYSISGKQHVDNHTTVIHAAAHCTSRELYKGVLDQRSRAVFHGRIKVEQDAQKTDATQANNNLLLSPHAEIDTKPQLEIYADDVKCAHGATVGQIDETSLFYLRSRGIDEAAARSLLTYAFVNDVMEDVDIEPLKTVISSELANRLISEDQ